MDRANVNDRAMLEQIYSRQDFGRDVGANSDAKTTVLRGVRIGPPDPDGMFQLTRASRHVGEEASLNDTAFVAPFSPYDAALRQDGTAYGEAKQIAAPTAEVEQAKDAYQTFLDQIVETARTAKFERPSSAESDDKLRGFHGG